MSFVFTPEQDALRDVARRFVRANATSSAVRRLMETERGFDETQWREMAALGWTGIAIPEAYGGIGGGYVDLAILLDEMGARLMCTPFFSSIVLTANVIAAVGTAQQKQALLPSIADGSVRAALALSEPHGWSGSDGIRLTATDGVLNGTKTFVVDGHSADLLVVAARSPDGVSLYSVRADAPGITRSPLETLDRTRKQARIDFTDVPAIPLGTSGDQWPELSKALDRAVACLSCEMVGSAQRCLDMAVDYAKTRTQFGRPIGSFQAIKHKCADMLIAVESARSASYHAAWAAAEDDAELSLAASLAKAYVSDAFFQVATDNIHVHGGIGFTWEHDAHLYFRRAKASEVLLGDASTHREWVAQRVGV